MSATALIVDGYTVGVQGSPVSRSARAARSATVWESGRATVRPRLGVGCQTPGVGRGQDPWREPHASSCRGRCRPRPRRRRAAGRRARGSGGLGTCRRRLALPPGRGLRRRRPEGPGHAEEVLRRRGRRRRGRGRAAQRAGRGSLRRTGRRSGCRRRPAGSSGSPCSGPRPWSRSSPRRNPDILTWSGRSLDNPGSTIALDVTPMGFHASVRGAGGQGAWLVDPAYDRRGTTTHLSYYAAAVDKSDAQDFVERETRLRSATPWAARPPRRARRRHAAGLPAGTDQRPVVRRVLRHRERAGREGHADQPGQPDLQRRPGDHACGWSTTPTSSTSTRPPRRSAPTGRAARTRASTRWPTRSTRRPTSTASSTSATSARSAATAPCSAS